MRVALSNLTCTLQRETRGMRGTRSTSTTKKAANPIGKGTEPIGQKVEEPRKNQVASPVFILASPRSFSSVVCAMIGQHPEMYAFPETMLFTAETVVGLWGANLEAPLRRRAGLKRAIGELVFGEQTESSIVEASGWLRRRSTSTTGAIFEFLADRVYPLRPVEKAPP